MDRGSGCPSVERAHDSCPIKMPFRCSLPRPDLSAVKKSVVFTDARNGYAPEAGIKPFLPLRDKLASSKSDKVG